MKSNFTKVLGLAALFIMSVTTASAGIVKGIVLDAKTREPLIGATVILENSTVGSVVGIDGDFELNLPNGAATLVVSFVTYQTQEIVIDVKDQNEDLLIEMLSDGLAVEEVKVKGRKNLETEMALQKERKSSTVAIENLGSKEMSVKGISNVEEGVKKMTGISVASAGQIIVRGLGDRYSLTTLNGQSIASPNPDNKLIPLDVFPSSAIKNITVSKVYNAESYADYSGAHIDITTKDQRSEKFFTVGLSVGGKFNTVGKDFYRMDNVSMFSKPSVDQYALEASKANYESYVTTKDIFDTDFSVSSKKSLPTFSGNVGYGNTYKVGGHELSILATGAISNSQEIALDNEYNVMEASGSITDSYVYDSYTTNLNMSALANIGLTMREDDNIGYTLFFARNALDQYQLREGDTDNQGHIFTSNNVTHIYSLLTHQLHGSHNFGERWNLGWDGSYTATSSEEPDRRQVMFTDAPDYSTSGDLILSINDQQSTMRYFGSLTEDEWNGDIHGRYNFGKDSKLTFGGAYKGKSRDYSATRFYYNNLYYIMNDVNGSDMYNTGGYLNFGNVEDGTIGIDRSQSPKDQYDATSEIYSAYASMDLNISEAILLNLGLRYENSTQTVNYYSTDYDTRVLKSSDLFPAMNLRYALNQEQQLRFAFSRTVTRPSFIEMSPFQYQESYGSAMVYGNQDLQNGYNYNLDLRYETFFGSNDMFSATLYYKRLDTPIERVQTSTGGATLHTFMNANDGSAAGVEVELRKRLIENLTLNVNGSYMYTNVKLSDGGVYTNTERQLQGASPYLVNADIAYTPTFGEGNLFTVALLYNLQGPRIYAVGINGNNDVIQDAYSKLNFVTSYKVSDLISLKAEINNLLSEDKVYRQKVTSTGDKVVVGRYNETTGASLGITLNF